MGIAAKPLRPLTGPSDAGRGSVRHLGADDRSSKRIRVVDGALLCLGAKGLKATTVDDIAQAAGMSRATLYRAFPGGREGVLGAVVETELARFFSALAVAMGSAKDLEEVLVAGMTEAARRVSSSAALAAVLADEPHAVLRHVSFGEMDHSLLIAADFARPFFGRWLEPEQAARAADWAVRIVVSYLLDPDPSVDLCDESSVSALVGRYVLPGILSLRQIEGTA